MDASEKEDKFFLQHTLKDEFQYFSREKLGTFYPAPIPTGIKTFDKFLGGGFTAGTILLGAQSSMGKSTLSLQIAQNIAKEVPVFYYSMEMSKISIIAKSISRQIYRQTNGNIEITARDLMLKSDDRRFSEEDWQQIDLAAAKVEEEMKQFYIFENLEKSPINGSKIYCDVSKNADEGRAVVFVDYLQILSSVKPDSHYDQRAIVDENLFYLRKLAYEKRLPVVIISSLSRKGYDSRKNSSSQKVQSSDFKESGGIEYTADILLALQFQNKKSKDNEKSKNPRKLELVIIKQRYGESDVKVNFDYYSRNDLFVEDGQPIFDISDTDKISSRPKTQDAQKRKEKTKLPKMFYINNCNIANTLYKTGHIEKDCPLKILVSSEKKIYSTISSMQEFDFSFYDKIVCDAVCTIWAFHQRDIDRTLSISPSNVLAVMTGKEKIRARQGNSSSKRENKIMEILERLGSTEIAIHCEEEIKSRKLKNEEEIPDSPICGTILPIKRAANSRKFELDLNTPPPLYFYASKVNRQIINIRMELITCENLKHTNTDNIIMLKHFLLQRIAVIGNQKNNYRNKKISYMHSSQKKNEEPAGLFSIMGIDRGQHSSSSWSNKKQALHKSVCALLDYYKEIGYIWGYTDTAVKEGCKRRSIIEGIIIEGHVRPQKELFSDKS